MPIATLEVGDWVLAYDEDTQQLGAYPVEATWSHEASQFVYLTVDGEVIKATANHPVYALGRGWVDAGALVPGDRLIEADGELGVVQTLTVAGERAVVYNLTVTDAHTYFVGEEQWWVHNCGRSPNRGPATHTVYEGVRGDQRVYVGITNDFTRRTSEHEGRFDDLHEIATNLTRYDARNIEQALIVHARDTGQALDNVINSISPRRADYLPRLEQGRNLLRQLGLLKD